MPKLFLKFDLKQRSVRGLVFAFWKCKSKSDFCNGKVFLERVRISVYEFKKTKFGTSFK